MFGSQVLETAIGLILMFFIIATGSSAIVEIVSRLFSKRARGLERTVALMLAGTSAVDDDVKAAKDAFRGTSIYDAAQAAAGKSLFRRAWKRPSYLSAESFSAAVAEMNAAGKSFQVASLPAGIRKRVQSLVAQGVTDVESIRASLEHWFDEAMARLEGAYKRWATGLLFAFGSIIAVAGNASTFHVAQNLWHDPVTRQVVADAAAKTVKDGDGAVQLDSVASTTDKLTELGLPVGWSKGDKVDVAHVAGCALTGLLVTLGAPFWFDLLSRLVSLRQAGAKPKAGAEPKATT